MLAYAATGRMPFGTSDSGVHALLFRIAEEEPELSGLSGGLHELVSACLAKDPERRPDLDSLISRTEGELKGTWLPGEVLAQLGRHAVQLLDSEDPEGLGETLGGPTGVAATAPAASPRPSTPPPNSPTGVYGPPASAPPYVAPQQHQPPPQQPWQQAPPQPSAQGPNGFLPSGPGTPPPSTRQPTGRVISPRKPAQTVTVLLSLIMVVHVISLIIDGIVSSAINDAALSFGALSVESVRASRV